MKHIWQGLSDFLKRYSETFKAVWPLRHEMDAPKRSADELAFLPANVELIETPVSPLPKIISRTIMGLFVVALLWAIFGKVDIVAVAPGKTIASGRTKIIQPIETATVHAIHVQDGQLVKTGQLLIELDATDSHANAMQASDAWREARMAEERWKALAQALTSHTPPQLKELNGIDNDRQHAEQNLATSQFNAFQAKLQNLQALVSQRQAELATTQQLIGPLTESADIADKRAKDFALLLEKKYVARHDYLAREQERINAQRELATQRSRLIELRSAIVGAQEQLAIAIADFDQQILDGMRQAREQIHQIGPQVAKTQQREQLMQMRSPVDGTVQQLVIHTVGGVVTPAQALMAIVPAEDALEVEATVLNKDIGFVRLGHDVTIKIESFPYTRYGYLTGKVLSISHDAAQDEKLGLVFPARVKLDKASLLIDGVKVNLSPGMALSVEIKTGKRRVIDYLLSPLQQHTTEALRER